MFGKAFLYLLGGLLLAGSLSAPELSADELTAFSIFRNVERLPGPGQNCAVSKTAPEILGADQPKYISANPLFGSVTLGLAKTTYYLAFDESRGAGTGYDLLYFDANANNDLTDDPPMKVIAGVHGQMIFPVKTFIGCGKGPSIYYGSFIVQSGGSGRLHVRLQTTGYFTGRVKFGDKEYKIAVLDANGNGLYNDYTGNIRMHDAVMVDDGSGLFNGRPVMYAQYIRVADDYYCAEISFDGSDISVMKPKLGLGALKLGDGISSCTVASDEIGMFPFSAEKGPAMLPPGRYGLAEVLVSRKDKDGRVWAMDGWGGWQNSGTGIEVVEGATAELKCDEPFTLKLHQNIQGREIICHSSFNDSAGRHYNWHYSGGSMPPPQTAEIRNAEGHLLARTTLNLAQYPAISWRIPDDYKGGFVTVTPSLAASPFEIKTEPLKVPVPPVK